MPNKPNTKPIQTQSKPILKKGDLNWVQITLSLTEIELQLRGLKNELFNNVYAN